MTTRNREQSPQHSPSNVSSAYVRERSSSRSRFKSRSRSTSREKYSSRRHRDRSHHKSYNKKDGERDPDDSYVRRSDRDKSSTYDRLSRERESRGRDRDRDRDRDRFWKAQEGTSSGGGPTRSRWEKRSSVELDDAATTGRWERDRDRERDKDRDRSRYEREDSIDSDSSSGIGDGSGCLGIGSSGSEIIGFKSQPPNNTIMIRGLAQHITENDIRQDIIQCGLMPKDIRLIRKKDTGASRGFAFVEFTTLVEATRWMEMKQGILMLQDQYRAIMQYSIPKELCPSHDKAPTHKASADWFCIKCGAQNFKRRDNCFKCHASRMESEEGGSGSDEICSYTTKTIMLRNLDALTTEDTIMSVLTNVVPELVKTISCVTIGRDPLTSTSRGICYLGTESTVDALAVYAALHNMQPPLTIDGKTVILSYCKYNMGDSRHVYAAPTKEEHAAASLFGATASVPTAYALQDVQRLAEYAASRYAKTDSEYHVYIEYYRNYFTQQINAGQSITLNQQDHYHTKQHVVATSGGDTTCKPNQSDATNAAAALVQSAIRQMNATKTYFDNTHMVLPTGTDGKRYSIPDPNAYMHDKATGYDFDPQTGLYYDPTSQYYWNSIIQKFLYWDQEKLTYMLAPERSAGGAYSASVAPGDAPMTDADGQPGGFGKKASKAEKQDKAKVAKKIAKDMERWAKTMNQRKEAAAGDTAGAQVPTASAARPVITLDIGYSAVMDANKLRVQQALLVNNGGAGDVSASLHLHDDQEDPAGRGRSDGLVAAYGGESETSSSGEEEASSTGEDSNSSSRWLDYSKSICLLCKRQLNSTEALTKHAHLSELHRSNLEKQRQSVAASSYSQPSTSNSGSIRYRDRARERRMKYGDPDEPTPSRLKEKFLRSRADEGGGTGPDGPSSSSATQSSSVLNPISSENVGNRLLQKMGWSEGQGLGKANQGRTTIIQAEQRASNVGLGNKSIYTGVAGESYKDCVKKMMYARYQELTERE